MKSFFLIRAGWRGGGGGGGIGRREMLGGLGNNVKMDLIDSPRIEIYENGKKNLGIQCDDKILQDCGFVHKICNGV